MTQKHTQYPELYATPVCDSVRGQEPRIRENMPAVRMVEGGKEIAIVVGVEGEIIRPNVPKEKATGMELATLFAAAPDLLEALKEAERIIKGFQYPDPIPPHNNSVSEARTNALAAIAKATGQE